MVLGTGQGAASLAVRYTRSSLLEDDAPGLRDHRSLKAVSPSGPVLARHALRNAILPIITVISLQLLHLVGGSVIIEQIFYWQGMGLLAIKRPCSNGITRSIMAFNLLSAMLVLSANLLADVAYAVADPSDSVRRTGEMSALRTGLAA